MRCATHRRLFAAVIAVLLPGGCGLGGLGGPEEGKTIIRVDGSDTMVNLAQAWAETYHKKRPDVSVQVLGSGSGVGIASLTDGNCDMANSSRKMTEKELKRVREKYRLDAKEHVVGYDALAIYVHPRNPIESISIDELAGIYGQYGTITQWSQLRVKNPLADKIIRISRQNSSGTYAYFRNAVLGKGNDYKLGSIDANGSKDVVALVSRTPTAIGYSGMGYKTPDVKTLPVSKKQGEPGVAPTAENARAGKYPITRPLLVYTRGEATGPVREYLQWILSPEGQEIVDELGYVPVYDHDAR
jgi:phosphate transport system substrate-binding protein